ncbi:MAG: hypothetical protein LBL72_03830 [Candidatus Accumulibacter sp.]|jgi:hypothetical protein|nr:hypothetical protein [Accumulibacter sp.]
MSDTTIAPSAEEERALHFKRIDAEISRVFTENEKMRAESERIRTEISKVMAETAKLQTETKWHPYVIAISLFAAGIAFAKLFI